MPTLNWIGKDKVINHHLDVPFRTLERKYSFDYVNGQIEDDNNSGNMIIHGDNLEALKALLPIYEGKISCIYLDPPYNTGNENWIYNDNVNDPKIRKWLGEIVGKEGEDLSRHDKWLCMMYPRLRLLQKLLCSEGSIVISIGHHELSNLISICREIFSTKQIVCVTVQTSGGKPSGGFNYLHEYLVFITDKNFEPNKLQYFGGVIRSPYEGLTLSTFNKKQRPNQVYPIFVNNESGNIVGVGLSLQERINKGIYSGSPFDFPYDYSEAPAGTSAIWPISSKNNECVWRLISSRLLSDWEKGYIKVSKNSSKNHSNKFSIQYLPEGVIQKIETGILTINGREPNSPTLILGKNTTVGSEFPTILTEQEFYTVKGTQQLKEIFKSAVFPYPKSVELIEEVIRGICSEGIVLDSFAGSGTTGHAVLNLNKDDGGHRQFILIEMEDYADSITAERIKRVINGYSDDSGTMGDFSFYELGKPLFNNDASLNESIETEEIRKFIWFMETRSKYEKLAEQFSNEYYLGSLAETDYYFYYKKSQRTALTYEFLATITKKNTSYVIYADTCTIEESDLVRLGIVYKKIPRDISKL